MKTCWAVDTTILNTAVPVISEALNVTPLSMKSQLHIEPRSFHSTRALFARRAYLFDGARARRRVRHEQIDCAVCGELFTPKRNDAVTCSNRCRQRLFRQRAR